ncbi:very short patch repair endonuclease [Methylocella sp.]|uniref:very short patch repair endonuclease n=1 Tax=Methylocella sp. TaxID=1978226 RepID=UPI0035B18DA6
MLTPGRILTALTDIAVTYRGSRNPNIIGDAIGSKGSILGDHLTSAERSAHMRKIRKIDTKPELVVRRAAHASGLRFRLHRCDLPGSPDLIFPSRQVAVFVHGCFWHQHEGCRLSRQPKSRLEYWLPKLRRNQERDARAATLLMDLGWRVVTVWECETADPTIVQQRLREIADRAMVMQP